MNIHLQRHVILTEIAKTNKLIKLIRSESRGLDKGLYKADLLEHMATMKLKKLVN